MNSPKWLHTLRPQGVADEKVVQKLLELWGRWNERIELQKFERAMNDSHSCLMIQVRSAAALGGLSAYQTQGAQQALSFRPPFRRCGRQRRFCSTDCVGDVDLDIMGCAWSRLPSEACRRRADTKGAVLLLRGCCRRWHQVSGPDSLGKPPRHVAGVGGGVSHASEHVVPADGAHSAAASLQPRGLGKQGRRMSNLQFRA